MNDFSLKLTTAIGDKWLVSNLLGEFDKDSETALKALSRHSMNNSLITRSYSINYSLMEMYRGTT